MRLLAAEVASYVGTAALGCPAGQSPAAPPLPYATKRSEGVEFCIRMDPSQEIKGPALSQKARRGRGNLDK
jgi:hypothetical protein